MEEGRGGQRGVGRLGALGPRVVNLVGVDLGDVVALGICASDS